MMKKIIWMLVMALTLFSAFAFASGVKVFSLDGNTWTPVSSSDKSNASGPYASPLSSPTSNSSDATALVYVYIEYTNVKVHVDIPGEWMTGNITITTVASHTPVRLTFSTSGNLRNGSHTIPTYYQPYDGNNSGYFPHQPLHAAVWKPADENWPTGMNGYQLTRGIGNHSFKLWMGVDVKDTTQKGRYTGWIQFSIVQVP